MVTVKVNGLPCGVCGGVRSHVQNCPTMLKPVKCWQCDGKGRLLGCAGDKANPTCDACGGSGVRSVADTEDVDHPAHYGGADDPFEAVKVIEAWLLGFNLGNCLKYIRRAGSKPGVSRVKDLRKAAWYLQREIANEEKAHARTDQTS